MTKIVVDIDELSKYSKQLGEYAVEFDNITNSMKSIVSSLESGWQGSDASSFIANATSYINNLSVVRQEIVNSSNTVAQQVNKYDQRIADASSRLGGNVNG